MHAESILCQAKSGNYIVTAIGTDITTWWCLNSSCWKPLHGKLLESQELLNERVWLEQIQELWTFSPVVSIFTNCEHFHQLWAFSPPVVSIFKVLEHFQELWAFSRVASIFKHFRSCELYQVQSSNLLLTWVISLRKTSAERWCRSSSLACSVLLPTIALK